MWGRRHYFPGSLWILIVKQCSFLMPFKKTVSGLIDWLVYENEEELFVVKVSDIYIKISYKNIVQVFHFCISWWKIRMKYWNQVAHNKNCNLIMLKNLKEVSRSQCIFLNCIYLLYWVHFFTRCFQIECGKDRAFCTVSKDRRTEWLFKISNYVFSYHKTANIVRLRAQ